MTFGSSQWPCGVYHSCCGGRWKSQNRKNVYLSPYVEEPLNSKVINSFVPELRGRVFRVSGFRLLYTHDQLYKHIIHIYLHMHAHLYAEHNNDTIKTSDTVLRKIYLSLIWKGCVWEGVRDRTELQHIDPHSIGHNRVSFPFSWAAQPRTWGPSLSGTCFHSSIFSPTRLISKLIDRGPEGSLCWVLAFSTASYLQLVFRLTDFLSSPSYIIVQCPPSSCGCHKLHSFNPSTMKATLCYSSTGCTCYLHRCISYFDSQPGRRSIYNIMFYVYMLWTFYVRFTYQYLAMVQYNLSKNKFFYNIVS